MPVKLHNPAESLRELQRETAAEHPAPIDELVQLDHLEHEGALENGTDRTTAPFGTLDSQVQSLRGPTSGDPGAGSTTTDVARNPLISGIMDRLTDPQNYANLFNVMVQMGLTELMNSADARTIAMRGEAQDRTIRATAEKMRQEGYEKAANLLSSLADFEAKDDRWHDINFYANSMAGMIAVMGGVPGFADPGEKPVDIGAMALKGQVGSDAQRLARFFLDENDPNSFFGHVDAVERDLLANYGGESMKQFYSKPSMSSATRDILGHSFNAMLNILSPPSTADDIGDPFDIG